MATLTARANWREHTLLVTTASLAGIVIAAGVVAATLMVLSYLHTMTAQLGMVSQRLDTLETMSRKLDGLTTMQRRLDHLDLGLTAMQGSLLQTNSKLGQRKALTGDMKTLDGDLRSMRGDIHVMAHKLDGSFLFRGVK